MSEEGRTAPAQKPMEPAETLPDMAPPSSVTAITSMDAGELGAAPGTLLAPVAALPIDDDDAIAIPTSAREPATGARRRGRMSLRIPDDEIARPLDGQPPHQRMEAPRSAPPARPVSSPLLSPPPAPLALLPPYDHPPPPEPPRPPEVPELPEPRVEAIVDVHISEDPFETGLEDPVEAAPMEDHPVVEAAPPEVEAPLVDEAPEQPAVAVMPMRIITIEPPPPDPDAPADYISEPPPSIVALDAYETTEPPPSLVALEDDWDNEVPEVAKEEEVRFEEELTPPERRPEAVDEISVEDVVEEAPRAELPQLPAMRPRAVSNPPAPPPTKRPAIVPPSPLSAPPSKPPLVIVPPHVGVAPQSSEASGLRRKGRLWWEDLFNDDYLRTTEKLTDQDIAREVDFIEDRLGIERGGSLLDLACGTGRHAIELARRGYQVVGFDLSLAMLARAGEEAQEREVKINFVQGDMREMTFEEQFDGVYCWGTSFGYFEEEKNAAVIDRVRRALRAGGLLLLDVVNRDFLVRQTPSLAWFEGDGCVCMDEMNVDFITSRMRVKRTMMLDDGRSREIEYSMRVYSLHELGKILHDQGFKVCEVSGKIATPGVFFGNESPRTIILAEKR